MPSVGPIIGGTITFLIGCFVFLHFKKCEALTVAEKSMASLLGGVASTCCTLPLDVLVARTQDAKKAGVKVSAWQLFREELRQKGWSGVRDAYMRGFEARLAHVCTTTVGTFYTAFVIVLF